MAFDVKKFEKAQIIPRTASIAVPGLIDWFDLDDDKRAEFDGLTGAAKEQRAEEFGVVWKVRGLSDDEFEQATKNANGNRARLGEVFAEMAQLGVTDAERIKDQIGANESVSLQSALRAEHILLGSVEPKINVQIAYKLGRTFPIEFRQIVTKILELSGLGGVDEKKLKPSGETKQSKAA